MKYEKAKVEVISFDNGCFMAFSGQMLEAVMTALGSALAGYDVEIDEDGEGFHCSSYGTEPLTIQVNGQSITYNWTNNGHQRNNYHI